MSIYDEATLQLQKAEAEQNIINAIDHYFEGLDLLIDELNNGSTDNRIKNKFATYTNNLKERCCTILNSRVDLEKEEIDTLWQVYEFFVDINYFKNTSDQRGFLIKLHSFDSKISILDRYRDKISTAIKKEFQEYKTQEKTIGNIAENKLLKIFWNLCIAVEQQSRDKEHINKQIDFVLSFGSKPELTDDLRVKLLSLKKKNNQRQDSSLNKDQGFKNKCKTLSLNGGTLSLKSDYDEGNESHN